MKNLLLILLFLSLAPMEAKASCYDSWINLEERNKNDREMLSKSAFVGKIRLDSFEYIKEKRGRRNAYYLTNVTIMQTYHGVLPNNAQISFSRIPK